MWFHEWRDPIANRGRPFDPGIPGKWIGVLEHDNPRPTFTLPNDSIVMLGNELFHDPERLDGGQHGLVDGG